MSDNSLVQPISINLATAQSKSTNDSQQNQPQGFPVTVTKIIGELVEVAVQARSKFTFPKIIIPQWFSAWVREPTQVGDKGWAVPCQYYLGGQSGLGGGTADLWPRGNMTTLVYQAVSQKQFPTNPTRDLNAPFINGPNGVVLCDTKKKNVLTLTPTQLTIVVGGTTFTFNAQGLSINNGAYVHAAGDVVAGYGGNDQVSLQQHIHPGTEPPVPGT